MTVIISLNSRRGCALILTCLLITLSVMLALATQVAAQAPTPTPTPTPPCAWTSIVHAPETRNVAYPDTNATYWVMPFDGDLLPAGSKMVISGQYTKARFFSFTVYSALGEVFDTINDHQIRADEGSENPFEKEPAGSGPYTYTITLRRVRQANPVDDALALPLTSLNGRIIYRVYVPNQGFDLKGGVPLPTIKIVDAQGNSRTLNECVLPPVTAAPARSPQAEAPPSQELCTPTRPDVLCFAPANFGFIYPNPAVNYIASNALPYRENKIIVVRAKAEVFPDSFKSGSIFKPIPEGGILRLRYWSMCNNEIASPLPVVACLADFRTERDDQNFFTYVIAPEESESEPRPRWIPADVNWLPWGKDTTTDNLLIFRSMLAPEGFPEEGTEFYPKAAYCDKGVFQTGGWQACFAAAGVN